jgi:hypothetical protein
MAVILKRCAVRCPANIIKVYFKNENKPIYLEVFIHNLKYINIFLILCMKCARKLFRFTVRREPKSLRTTDIRRADGSFELSRSSEIWEWVCKQAV